MLNILFTFGGNAWLLQNLFKTREIYFLFYGLSKLVHQKPYHLLFLFSILVHPFTYFIYRKRNHSNTYDQAFALRSQYYIEHGLVAQWQKEFGQQEIAKATFLKRLYWSHKFSPSN